MERKYKVEFISEDIRLAVKRGAYWLDEKDPEWIDKIKLESLKMQDYGQCVLGQTFGNYWNVDEGWDRMEWPAEHGFNISIGARQANENGTYNSLSEDYDLLGKAWTELIEERRLHR